MTSLYTKLVSGLLFPIHEHLKRHNSTQVRREMERTQWLGLAELEGLQLHRLNALLLHAQHHVPYYQALFAEIGFNVSSVASLQDLQRLPFLTKAVIHANQEDLKADNAMNLSKSNTGGSSGEPLIFFLGNERVSHDVAAKWRATRWWDVDIGDKEIVVWGSPIELGAQDRVRMIRDYMLRTTLLPAFEMSEAKLEAFVDAIRSFRPKMLFGYPSALSHIARYAEAKAQTMTDLGIKVAFVTSERLYDDQRAAIERVFGCPVANGYGGRDAGFIAHQCPAGGMHITAEDIIVEIIDQNGHFLPPGQAGEIVVTHLATRDFPFIRYRTGDIGILDDKVCECGRGLPLFRDIQGRTTDFIIAADGTVMHGLALIYVIRELPGIRSFKIVQESLSTTRIFLVTEGGFESGSLDKIREGFKKRLGSGVNVIIEQVSDIPPEKSGKHRYVVSNVAKDEMTVA